MPRCFKISPADNVATMLDDAGEGNCTVLGDAPAEIHLLEPVKLGHKIALCDIAAEAAVVKFAVPIGRASRNIRRGEWVHLHNLASNFDQRSQTLDLHSGAATDMKYE